MIPFFGPFVSWLPPVAVALLFKPERRAARPDRDGHRVVRDDEHHLAAADVGRRRHPPDRRPRLGRHRRQDRGHRRRDLRHPDRRRPLRVLLPLVRPVARERHGRRPGDETGRRTRGPRRQAATRAGARASTPTSTRSPARGRRRRPERRPPRPARRPRVEASGEPERDEPTPTADSPDMTRERARSERRDLDKERGEPVAGTARRQAASLKRIGPAARRLDDAGRGSWSPTTTASRSRGILALKQALDPIGDVTVVAPDTNQSAVGHQKTLMRPLRVRERTLADGSMGYSVDGSPTDCVSLAFLGFFEERFDLVASGINYGANLGDDITYSGTVSAAMEAVINNCPAFAISQEYYEHVDFALAAAGRRDRRPQHPRARPQARRAAQRQRAGGLDRGLRGLRGHPGRPPRLPGRAHRAGRPARHPLLLDRRAAAVRDQRPGHGLQRGRQPAGLGHADPPRPHGPPACCASSRPGTGRPGTRPPRRDPGRRAERRRPVQRPDREETSIERR